VRRGAKGRFKEPDDVGKSLAADRRTKAKTKVKSEQGDRGDRLIDLYSETTTPVHAPCELAGLFHWARGSPTTANGPRWKAVLSVKGSAHGSCSRFCAAPEHTPSS
jgi:hypothetical protein